MYRCYCYPTTSLHLTVFRFDTQSGSVIFDSLHQHHVVVMFQARAVECHTEDSISIRLWHAVRFLIRGYLRKYLISVINPDTLFPIHNPSFCFNETFNSPAYSRFTTRALTIFTSTSSEDTPLTRPFVHCFASPHLTPSLASDLAIIDTSYPPPEPTNFPSSLLFDGWFGIPFLDADNITHVRSPQPSELLELYRLPTLLPLYLLIGSDLLRSSNLHFPPRSLVLRISSAIIRDVCFSYSQVFKPSHLPISY